MKGPVFTLKGVRKVFRTGDEEVKALDGIDLEIRRGEFVAVVGPSGSGKTTLLNVMGGIERPDAGEVWFMGRRIDTLPEGKLSDLRLQSMGFVFQSHNLIPTLTAEENAEFVLFLRGVPAKERRRRVREVFSALGIENLAGRFPSEMSGGQQQRVAIARAIVGNPAVVLADEPTANLDSENTVAVVDLMLRINSDSGTTFVLSTHDPLVIERAKRVVRMRDGKIVGEG